MADDIRGSIRGDGRRWEGGMLSAGWRKEGGREGAGYLCVGLSCLLKGVYLDGLWFGFVRFALLLADVLC